MEVVPQWKFTVEAVAVEAVPTVEAAAVEAEAKVVKVAAILQERLWKRNNKR